MQDNMFAAILSTSHLIIQKGEKTLLRMILEYYSKQCLMLKKKIMSTLIKHKECVSVLQLGFTQNASRPLLFSALESLENLPNIHILYLFFSDAHDNSHHSFGCKSETVFGSNYFNYWFT